MPGILNYAAPPAPLRKATMLGMLSTGIAILVFALPSLMTASSFIMEEIIGMPGGGFLGPGFAVALVVVPTVAMLSLPLLGLLFGAMGISVNRRQSDFAVVGLVINLGGLIAGMAALCM